MSRVLLHVSWIAGGIAWAALILLWRDLFLAAGITSAVATLAWGYCTEPDRDPDDWSADEWWHEGELEDAR